MLEKWAYPCQIFWFFKKSGRFIFLKMWNPQFAKVGNRFENFKIHHQGQRKHVWQANFSPQTASLQPLWWKMYETPPVGYEPRKMSLYLLRDLSHSSWGKRCREVCPDTCVTSYLRVCLVTSSLSLAWRFIWCPRTAFVMATEDLHDFLSLFCHFSSRDFLTHSDPQGFCSQ